MPRLGDRQAPVARDEERIDEVHGLGRVGLKSALDRRDRDRPQEVLGQSPRLDRERAQPLPAEAGEEPSGPLRDVHPGRRAAGVLGTAERQVHRGHVGRAAQRLRNRLGRLEGDALLRLHRGSAEVRRRDDVRQLEQRLVRIGRLGIEHVERRARESAGDERLVERRSVDQASPRHVDQDPSGLHARELLAADERPASLGRRRVQGHDVGGLQELFERDERDAHLVRFLDRKVWIVTQEPRLERAGAGGHAGPDLPEADDSERLARELGAQELRLLPLSGGDRSGRFRHPAQQREEKSEGVLDRGDDVPRRGVDDEDAAGRRRRDVDVVDSDPGAADHRQMRRGGEELRVHFRAAPDEKRVGGAELRQQLRAVGAGELDDLVTRLAEDLEARRRQLLGDDDPAHSAIVGRAGRRSRALRRFPRAASRNPGTSAFAASRKRRIARAARSDARRGERSRPSSPGGRRSRTLSRRCARKALP